MGLQATSLKRTLLALGSGLAAALTISVSIALFRTGELPQIATSLSYISAAGRLGFTALETPDGGIHWILLTGLLWALGIGTARWYNDRRIVRFDSRQRTLTSALIFFGIAGSGAFSYYMNRSHWHVLLCVSSIAFFPIVLFAAAVFENATRARALVRLSKLPRVICLVFIAGGLAHATNTPNPFAQFKRLNETEPSYKIMTEKVTAIVKSYSTPGEKIAICYNSGHLIAERAGVLNIFPYTLTGSIVLRSQLDAAIHSVEKNSVRLLFGSFPVEMSPWMVQNGFVEVDRYLDFSVIKKRDTLPTR
jgi:hypothetical protein